MGEVIYVDVLIVINIYINYGLLLLTCFIRKYNPDRKRLLISALLGGFYSLIIVLPGISDRVVAVSRIPAVIIMLAVAFSFDSKKIFFRFLLAFLAVNMLFAGGMFLLWYIFAPENMYFNNGVVYFNIDTPVLIVLTAVVYLFVRVTGISADTSAPINTVYRLTLTVEGKTYEMKAVYDTGNTLTDPFTGEGVIVVDAEKAGICSSQDIYAGTDGISSNRSFRLIPAATVSGSALLPALRAEKAEITGVDISAVIRSPVIAFSKSSIFSGECGALLPSSVFDNTDRTGDNYGEKIKKNSLANKK